MIYKAIIINGFASLGLIFGMGLSPARVDAASFAHAEAQPANQFRRIEQPLVTKTIVTIAGVGAIGLELWWFLLSRPGQAKTEEQSD